MTAAFAETTPGPAPQTFEIKSAQLPLVALKLKTDQLDALQTELAAHFGAGGISPGFFDHEGLVIDFSALQGADAEAKSASGTPDLLTPLESLDMARLIALLRAVDLVPLAVRGANASLTQAALAAGLVLAPEQARRRFEAPAAVAQSEPTAPSPLPPPREHRPMSAAAPTTLVIDKPLRSGQKAYARGGDLVVLAMVNQGAEVVADGNIHVYAPLRGKALAGARGDTSARIFALSMEPELVSIAGIYRTSETEFAADVRGKPAQVRLGGAQADKLLVEPLKA